MCRIKRGNSAVQIKVIQGKIISFEESEFDKLNVVSVALDSGEVRKFVADLGSKRNRHVLIDKDVKLFFIDVQEGSLIVAIYFFKTSSSLIMTTGRFLNKRELRQVQTSVHNLMRQFLI